MVPSPRFARATSTAFPIDGGVRLQSNIPMGVIFSPLAEPRPSELPVSVVNFEELGGEGTAGPPRCTRCYAYINCFCEWTKVLSF